jgi:hypothetical protein
VNAFEFTLARSYRRGVRWLSILFVAFFAITAVRADSAKVLKVLPQFLDKDGRASKSPSLFDRDAYQVHLRDTVALRSGIQFVVNWKASGYDELKLRVEAKGGSPREPKTTVLEEVVRPGVFRSWSTLKLDGERYKIFGELISWRVTLWNGTNQVAEQKSFLW